MKGRPINLNDWEVRALLECTEAKATLFRLVDPQWRKDIEPKEHSASPGYWIPYLPDGRLANGEPGYRENDCGIKCPFGVVGDRLCTYLPQWAPRMTLEVMKVEMSRVNLQWQWVIGVKRIPQSTANQQLTTPKLAVGEEVG